jgi:tRNA(Ile2)-agmatinylcytidine synthase
VAVDGEDIVAYSRGSEPSPHELSRAFGTARGLIQRLHARDPATQPALAAGIRRPPESFYWRAVRRLLPPDAAAAAAAGRVVHEARWNGGRGFLGALAAAAWRGANDHTWEAIAYRDPSRVGSARRVEDAAVAALDARFAGCFDSWDPVHAVARVVPASPCPVLAGVRGEDPEGVQAALGSLGPEEASGHLTFRSNQATDDHVAVGPPAPWAARAVEAVVDGAPVDRRGGHVFVDLAAGSHRLRAAAFEPTKQLRAPVRRLRRGDRVVAVGSFHEDARAMALEKLLVMRAEPTARRVNPTCVRCGLRMKSRGRGAGFRCRGCRSKAPAGSEAVEWWSRDDIVGAYEAPVAVRRHLAKPLGRL